MSLRQHLPHTGLVVLIILLVVIKQVSITESLFFPRQEGLKFYAVGDQAGHGYLAMNVLIVHTAQAVGRAG